MDHAHFSGGVVCRGVPGISSIIIGAVRKRPQGCVGGVWHEAIVLVCLDKGGGGDAPVLPSLCDTLPTSAMADGASAPLAKKAKTDQPAPSDGPNVLQLMLQGDVPCHRIFKTEHSLSVLAPNQNPRGRVLLIPTRPWPDLLGPGVPPEDFARFMADLPPLVAAVKRATGAPNVSVRHDTGAIPGAAVPRVFVEVLPCGGGGGGAPLGDGDALHCAGPEAGLDKLLRDIKAGLPESHRSWPWVRPAAHAAELCVQLDTNHDTGQLGATLARVARPQVLCFANLATSEMYGCLRHGLPWPAE